MSCTQDTPLNSTVWGPLLWQAIHIMAEGYPLQATQTHQNKAYNFFTSLGYMLPCELCRGHYQEWMVAHDADLQNALRGRDALAEFVIRFHNMVNKRLQKPQWHDITEVRAKYQHMHKFAQGPPPVVVIGGACTQRNELKHVTAIAVVAAVAVVGGLLVISARRRRGT